MVLQTLQRRYMLYRRVRARTSGPCSARCRPTTSWFLDPDEYQDENISNLKLQKLCYYAQGLCLAGFTTGALFDEDIVAWQHGPVIRELWDTYRVNGLLHQPDRLTFGLGIRKMSHDGRT